ncbi:MAG: hypothetical protein NUV46_04725 [Nanoarchaeota archaeon]|nr:hypothetical protein [Nanoarchaeota archaeon]
MNRYTSSEEVIKYLKTNLNEKNFLSFFTAGSIPKELIPGSDLDLFFIVRGTNKNNFFDSLDEISKKFIHKKRNITYSFFRGPLKFKTKALIHFIVYTEENHSAFGNREQFKHELEPVVNSLINSSKLISGIPLNKLIKKISRDNRNLKEDINYLGSKYDILKKEGFIKYREWKKCGNDWKFLDAKIYPNKFLKNYLIKYYEKNLK